MVSHESNVVAVYELSLDSLFNRSLRFKIAHVNVILKPINILVKGIDCLAIS